MFSHDRFLLSALQVETVLAQSSISKRRAALATIPEKLEAAFQAIISKIHDECPAGFNLGMEVLKWTYLVERQLSIQELGHILAAAELNPTVSTPMICHFSAF